MLKNKYDLILFDLDGTVADTDEVIVQSLFKMYDLYRNGNRSPREKVVYFSGPPMRETLKAEFPGGDNDFLFSELEYLGITIMNMRNVSHIVRKFF